jgi:arabinan endo-1,5-alpha-L-arabinosidase
MNTSGLVNYWPLVGGNTRDFIAQSDLFACINMTFVADRFGNPNSAIYLNNGFCKAPPGVYFSLTLTVMGWLKIVQPTSWSRFFDFGNGPAVDVVVLTICADLNPKPVLGLYSTNQTLVHLVSSFIFNLNQWYHLATVHDAVNSYIYINGVLSASQATNHRVNAVVRMNNFIGKSNWAGDANANAIFDDIRIYNRGLSGQEILNEMVSFN